MAGRNGISIRNCAAMLLIAFWMGPLTLAEENPNEQETETPVASYRLIDGGLKCLIAFGGAERFAQIGCIILTQAHVQRARTGQPHTVAAFAKIMGQGRNKPKLAAGLVNLHITRGSTGPEGNVRQGPVLFKPLADGGQRKVLVDTVAANITHGHGLDEGQIVSFVAAPFEHAVEFGLIEILQCDGVDFDG